MRTIITCIISLLIITTTINAQDTMYVHQKVGGILKVRTSNIDSIVFNAKKIKPIDTIVTDIDGNVYNTITIGTQIWMAKNLKVTKYNDGIAIPLVTDAYTWNNISSPAYCWYNNDQVTNGKIYGALYKGYTVKTGRLCPTGWHVPTHAEWITLTDYLGGESIAGGKLKETGTTYWNSPNTGATNETGFSALPGGYRNYDGSFNLIGNFGFWWSASDDYAYGPWYRYLSYNLSSINKNYDNRQIGFSVRCIKD